MSKQHRGDRRRYWSEAWARQIDARTFSGVIFRVHPAASLVGEACFSKFKKNYDIGKLVFSLQYRVTRRWNQDVSKSEKCSLV